MAKISARGAHEIARWKNHLGATIVLTSDGRLLQKLDGAANYSIWYRKVNLENANRLAERFGYRSVPTRN